MEHIQVLKLPQLVRDSAERASKVVCLVDCVRDVWWEEVKHRVKALSRYSRLLIVRNFSLFLLQVNRFD